MRTDWTIKDLLLWTADYFQKKGIEQPRLEAEVLLAHVLERDRVFLYANYDAPAGQGERELYRQCIQRRVKGEPLAYITGYKEFMSLPFAVGPEVLIPRPETELLVEKAIELARQQSEVRICDVGTGSGAIAVSLAYYLPQATVTATDISPEALELARRNADFHQVHIEFYQGNLLEPVIHAGSFSLIVANLPYINEFQYRTLDRGILDYEPRLALWAPDDGLEYYRQLLPPAWSVLLPGGFILFEIGHDQGTKALELAQDFGAAELLRDLAGRERLVQVRKKV